MGPVNGIIGDAMGTELPEAVPDEAMLTEEKKMARYSKTAEFKRIEQHFKERIEFYQKFLPDGRPIAQVPAKDLEGMWIAANTIIGELSGVLDSYQTAAEVVNELNSK